MPWSPRPLLLAAILLGRAVPFSLPAPRVAASRLAPHRVASSPQLGLGKLLTRARTKLTDRVVSKLDVRLDRYRARRRPKRIILVRHGQSMGNTNRSAYASVPDSRIPLTERGFAQGAAAGMQIRKLVGNETTRFYYSPYLRARQTLVAILQAFTGQEVDVQAEPRLREQARLRRRARCAMRAAPPPAHARSTPPPPCSTSRQRCPSQDFGNFQNAHEMDAVMSERQKFGRFYYRFPNGEAGTDVYDRVSDYLTSLFSTMDGRLLDGGRWRNVENQYDTSPHVPDNLVLVTHGLLMRIFCMCYFRWTPSEFEQVAPLASDAPPLVIP